MTLNHKLFRVYICVQIKINYVIYRAVIESNNFRFSLYRAIEVNCYNVFIYVQPSQNGPPPKTNMRQQPEAFYLFIHGY